VDLDSRRQDTDLTHLNLGSRVLYLIVNDCNLISNLQCVINISENTDLQFTFSLIKSALKAIAI